MPKGQKFPSICCVNTFLTKWHYSLINEKFSKMSDALSISFWDWRSILLWKTKCVTEDTECYKDVELGKFKDDQLNVLTFYKQLNFTIIRWDREYGIRNSKLRLWQ